MSLEEIEQALRKELALMNRPVLICMGNEIKRDDGVGIYIAGELGDSGPFTVLNAATQPENFTGKVISMNPSHVVFVDAAMISGEPGSISTVSVDDIDELCVHTHHMPLIHIVQRLIEKCGCKVLIIGIKPVSMEPGEWLSPPVKQAADALVSMIRGLDNG